MSDLGDVTDMLEAFQRENSVAVKVTLSVPIFLKPTTLVLEAESVGVYPGDVVPARLAFVRLTCSDIGVRSLGAALIHALYVMDSQLAFLEMGRADNTA